MKSKAIIPLAVGLVVGFVAIKYTMDAVRKARGSNTAADLVEVVVARKDIASTSFLKPEMLAVVESPRTPLLPAHVFSKLEQLKDRVALKSIPQGSPILPSMLAPKGSEAGIEVRVKEGFRAVAVRIDESSGVGYLVKPGDWVDVLSVMEIKTGGRKETKSVLILERVQVGAVGQILNENQKEEDASANTHAQTVTLLVKVDDVPKLHFAQTRGKITLALRGTDDLRVQGTMFDKQNENSKSPGLGAAFASMWKHAAESSTPTVDIPPTPVVPTTTSVAVVNGSSQVDGNNDVEVVTFRDDQVLSVKRTKQRGRRPQSRGARDLWRLQTEEGKGKGGSEPHEVTE